MERYRKKIRYIRCRSIGSTPYIIYLKNPKHIYNDAIRKVVYNMKVGNKYYKFLDDETLSVLRLTKIKNDNDFVLRDLDNNVVKLNKNELEQYTLLRADGFITFAVVELEQNTKDVIVMLHRRKDLEAGDNVPYCVCRQNIFDMFANQIIRENIIYIGASVSKDTCPQDVPYNITVACNDVVYSNTIAVYLDDTLETILSMLNQHKYNETLKSMYGTIVNPNLRGYCTSLKQLLTENYFMYDFLKAFNIYPVNLEIDSNTTDQAVLTAYRSYIENLLKVAIVNIYIGKYNKDIDLSKIQREFVLVSDKNSDVYIIGYDRDDNSRTIEYNAPSAKEDYMIMVKYKNSNN